MIKRNIEVMEGRAYSNGFILKMENYDDRKHIVLQTEKCDPFLSFFQFSWKFLFCCVIACFFLLFCMIILRSLANYHYLRYFCGCFIACFSSLSLWEVLWVFMNRNIREWHACEHKVSNLLESDKSINMDNLKKSPREHLRCGTRIGVYSLFAFPYYLAILLFSCYFYNVLGFYWFSGAIFLSFVFYLFFMVYVMAFIFQKFVTTAKPSDDKLRESLELALKADELLKKV
jgi:hypothetical protein